MKDFVEFKICDNITVKRSVESIVNERIHPKPWQWAYLEMAPLLRAIKKFARMAQKEKTRRVIDLGCGVKPYRSLFMFADEYIGTDINPNKYVDVVGENWNLPFPDSKFDCLISTQVLEHTAKIAETVGEIKRIVKPGGLIFISVPLAFPEHEIPYDYYRFTRYGLREIFTGFEIMEVTPLSGYLNTLLRLWNNFLHYFPGASLYLAPIFLLNNGLAILLDWLAAILVLKLCRNKKLETIYDKFYLGFPSSYIMILRNMKE